MDHKALKSYANEFRQKKYQAEVRRSLFHFFKFLVFVFVFFLAQFFLLRAELGDAVYIAIAGLIAFFHGLTYLSLWLIGHDCGHGSFSKNKKLNRLVGSISTAFMLMNYENFRRSHNMHHKFIGNIEKDEAFGPKAKRKNFFMQKMIRCVVLIPFLAYLLAILFPGLTKTPGYVNYFWPDKSRNSIKAFGFVVGKILLLVLMAIFLPWPYFVFRRSGPHSRFLGVFSDHDLSQSYRRKYRVVSG